MRNANIAFEDRLISIASEANRATGNVMHSAKKMMMNRVDIGVALLKKRPIIASSAALLAPLIIPTRIISPIMRGARLTARAFFKRKRIRSSKLLFITLLLFSVRREQPGVARE